jgi:hypothetical protein
MNDVGEEIMNLSYTYRIQELRTTWNDGHVCL